MMKTMTFLAARKQTSGRWLALAMAGLLVGLPLPAKAALGDNAASVLADQARMKGTLHSTDYKTYVVHEITVTGTVVREYVSPGGAVFGVSWEGQFQPDFQQLLGSYYAQVKQAAAAQPSSARRAPLSVSTAGLVFQQSGHPRSFHGMAY